MAGLIEEVEVGNTVIKVKFQRSLRVSSISNSDFALLENAATPVTSPFKAIDLTSDYNSISRVLTLKYVNPLKSETDYDFIVSNLYSASGILLDSETVSFTTGVQVVPSLQEILEASNDEPPVEVEDHSIKSAVFSSEVIVSNNPSFYVVDTSPSSDTTILDVDSDDGRVVIKFSAFPMIGFVDNTYFQTQRKLMSRGFHRWESLTSEVSLDDIYPWVYVDFPSIDATPVYHAPNHIYFEEGYKYRVKVSKSISI